MNSLIFNAEDAKERGEWILKLDKYFKIEYFKTEGLIMPYINNNQRQNSISNSQVGTNFEQVAFDYFKENENIVLNKNYELNIGVKIKKRHKFDLGNENILVECKSHKWTNGNNPPSAKMSVWNEAMFYFNIAPKQYKKILFVLMDFCQKRCKTLVQYYIENYHHFIPEDVIFYEYNPENGNCEIYDFEKWSKFIYKTKNCINM